MSVFVEKAVLMSLTVLFPFPKRGSILIISTIAVILMLAVCGSLVLQIRTDVRSTQTLKYHEMILGVARGAIYESLNQLNNPSPATHSNGNIGVTNWNPKTDDVGLDGIPNTNDEGEKDGYPTFALPGSTLPGEPGGTWQRIEIKDYGEMALECYYLVYDEDFGTNKTDDNQDASGDASLIDDLEEASFHRLKAVATYGGQQKKIEALIGNSENFYLFEGFFKAIYVGNASNTSEYALDLGGENPEQFDDIEGDIYVHGNIRLRNTSMIWQKEHFEDRNGNGIFDLGESVKEVAGQEVGFYNLGSEATGDIRVRTLIGEDWQIKNPVAGEHPSLFTENAPLLSPPDFKSSLNRVTIKVAEEFKATGTPYSFVLNKKNLQGLHISNPDHPAHLFVQLPSEPIASYAPLNNGLNTYLLSDVTSSNPSVLMVSPNGNREVYFIDGNLLIHSEAVESMTFQLKNASDPVRLTFLVQGNILFEENLIYRNSKEFAYTQKEWNPFNDAIAFIALKNKSASSPEQTGNIFLADLDSQTLDRIDGYLFAENDVFSDPSSISPRFNLNGSLGAGNLLRVNQASIQSSWRALPDAHRTQLVITFDTRIRQFIRDREWLPGLPGGQNRTIPPIPKRFNNLLSWTER